MQTLFRAFFVALLIGLGADAGAQTVVTRVDLRDPEPATWEATGHMGWLTVNKTGLAPEWNRWYDVAAVGATVSRFFGPHWRAELDVATSASAEVYVQREVRVPNITFPVLVSQPQRFRMTTVAAGASYQFLDNRWFHPVVGAGIESARELREVSEVIYPVQTPVPVTIDPPGTTATWTARPYAIVGFKWYVGERAFLRSDVRSTFDRDRVGHVVWRGGVGFDF